MNIRNCIRAFALATLVIGAPGALEAQDSWDLPIDRNRMIRTGESKVSSLDSGDRALGDGSYFEAWFFEGRAGQRVTITLSSSAFDTFLAVGRHNGDVIETNDDFRPTEGTDSRISIVLPADGIYMIRANSLEAGKTGEYALTLEDGPGTEAADVGISTGGSSGGTMAAARVFGAPVDRARMLQSGRQVTSSLDANDNKLDDDSYFEAYYIELAAGQKVTVTMQSLAFDTYLSIAAHGATEAALTNDDGEEGSTDSRLEFTASTAGTHVIIANSLEAGKTGGFVLMATVSGGESVGGAAGDMMGGMSKAPASPTARVIAEGQTVSSELSAEDQRLDDGSYYELWLHQGPAGSRVTITLRSTDFDAYLTIRDASGESLGTDDDSGGDTDAQVTVTIPANGRIAIVANTLEAGETGRYTLQVTRAN